MLTAALLAAASPATSGAAALRAARAGPPSSRRRARPRRVHARRLRDRRARRLRPRRRRPLRRLPRRGAALLCGVVPLCSLVPLAVDAARGRERSPQAARCSRSTIAFAAWLVLEVGVFAWSALRFVERDLLGLGPPLFLGFACGSTAARRGATRSPPPSFVAAAALVVAVPYDRFVVPRERPGLADFRRRAAGRCRTFSAGGRSRSSLCRRSCSPCRSRSSRAASPPRSPGSSSSRSSSSRSARAGRSRARARPAGADARRRPGWIDRAAGRPDGFVFGGSAFFTTASGRTRSGTARIAAVYDTPGARVTGRCRSRSCSSAATACSAPAGPDPRALRRPPLRPDAGGRARRRDELVGADQSALSLWRLDGPPRILEQRLGFAPNGDVSYEAVLREYACRRGGTFLVTLLGKTDQEVVLELNGRRVQTVRLRPGESRRASSTRAPPRTARARWRSAPRRSSARRRPTFARG